MSRRDRQSYTKAVEANEAAFEAVEETAEVERPTVGPLGPSLRRLDAAHKHLDRYFADASGEQIDGRRFHGRVTVSIIFVDGEAADVLVSKEARDRFSGGRPDAKAWAPGV